MNTEKAMTLNDIEELCRTENREVEFVFAGHHTGWILELRPESSDEVQECVRRFNARVRKSMIKRNTSEFDALSEKHADDLRIAHVAGWRYEKGEGEGRPPFSKKELRSILNRKPFGWHLGQFIDREVGTIEDFLEESESNLESASGGTPGT